MDVKASKPVDSDSRLWSALDYPYGYSEASEQVGTIAAPLLAGFAFALIGLTLDKRDALGLPDQALLLLVSAGIALITAVQLNFHARKYHFSPGEYFDLQRLAAEDGIPIGAVKKMGRSYLLQRRRWSQYGRLAYNIGVTILYFGVAATLVPAEGIPHMSPLRVVAVVLPAIAGLVEAGLILREGTDRLHLE